MWRTSFMCCVAMLFASLFSVSTGFAQDESAPTKLTLYPAAEPTPALKYRLLPPFLETIPGNAAVYYGKVTAEQSRYFASEEHWDNMNRWREMPLQDLRGKNIDTSFLLEHYHPLPKGAQCRFCDWQLPIGDVPFYELLLPQAQGLRQFGRILATDARIQLARGNLERALLGLQRGYSLGRHTAMGETLVNGLVGTSICRLMSDQLLEYVQIQGAPNLYWALTDLPRPLIDMRRGFEIESEGVSINFPEIQDFSNAELGEGAWLNMLTRLATIWSEMDLEYEMPTPEEIDRRCKKLNSVAQQRLIEYGVEEDRVAKMSRYQIAVLYTAFQDRCLLQDAAKFISLPYPESIAGIDSVIEKAKNERFIVPIALETLSAFRIPRTAIAQNDREIAVLRVMEALRIYGAHHNGRLPQRLQDIKEVPVPDDPVTAEPFIYHLDGQTATLRGPAILDTPLNYEIEMVSAEE